MAQTLDLGRVVGKDGKSPTVNVSKSGKVTTLTITDANGTKTVTINDGEDGAGGGISYEVGDVFISANATSPAQRFGGTWEQIKDKFLLAAGDTYAAGSTGGEATHKLTKGEMPHHTHPLPVTNGSGVLTIPEWTIQLTDGSWISQGTVLNNVNAGASAGTGESLAHNNMPPYEVFYAWKKVA